MDLQLWSNDTSTKGKRQEHWRLRNDKYNTMPCGYLISSIDNVHGLHMHTTYKRPSTLLPLLCLLNPLHLLHEKLAHIQRVYEFFDI